MVILAREAGIPLSMADVAVESLIPPALQSVQSLEAFMKALPEHDGAMKAKVDAAHAAVRARACVCVVIIVCCNQLNLHNQRLAATPELQF